MKINLKDGKLEIDIYNLVQNMSDEAKSSFYEHLAFEEKLLEACFDMAVGDSAFDGNFHSTTYGNIITRLSDKLRKRLLPAIDEASKKQIENLERDKEYYNKEAVKWQNYAWKLQREWPTIIYQDGEPLPVVKLPECPRSPL